MCRQSRAICRRVGEIAGFAPIEQGRSGSQDRKDRYDRADHSVDIQIDPDTLFWSVNVCPGRTYLEERGGGRI